MLLNCRTILSYGQISYLGVDTEMRSICLFAIAAAAACLSSNEVRSQSTAENYEYDALGRLVGVVDHEARRKYNYDDADNRSEVIQKELFPQSWVAVSLPHVVGYAEAGGWAAHVGIAQGHMTYGPYATDISTGSNVAVWKMMIDVVDGAPEDRVVTIDVYDATAGEILAIRRVNRREWLADFTYQMFELPFEFDVASEGHAIEFRTYHHANSYVRIERIGYYSQ